MSSPVALNHLPFSVVGIFGSAGTLGSRILRALLDPPVPNYRPKVVAFQRPGQTIRKSLLEEYEQLEVRHVDYSKGGEELVASLRGVDAIISVLSGPAVHSQFKIFDAAVLAGVKRFYPSEFGFHQAYRAPGDPGARVMPLWDDKERFALYIKLHPAVESGQITYTFIGAGDLYDQEPEPFWCPWVQDSDSYDVPVVGDGDTLADWSHIEDIARYTVATLSKPSLSVNAHLNFPSETISQNAMVDLLRKYAKGREVHVKYFSQEDAHKFAANPEEAPKEIGVNSRIPVDFYFVVKSIQGSGQFRRPRWDCHWDLFPEVKRTTFEEYLQERFDKH